MSIPPGFYDHFEVPSGWKWEFEAFVQRKPLVGGRLLDVGCGDGYFLKMAQEAGYDVHGIDSSEQGIRAAQQRGLTRVHRGFPSDFFRKYGGAFDVVTCFHTLEHVEDPSGFLGQLCRFLRPGGLLVLGVPNARRFTVRLRREIQDFPPTHLTRWTAEAMDAFLKRHGLKVHEVAPEIITLSSVERTGYALWIALNTLTQTGLIYRARIKTSISPESAAAPSSPSGVQRVARLVSPFRSAANQVLRRVLGRALLTVARDRELQGPGLLAVAEKPAR